jgi:hypothetical protein
MFRFSRSVLMFTASLCVLWGSGFLHAFEIESVVGRPWDSGSIGVDEQHKNNRVYKKDPNARTVSSDEDVLMNNRETRTPEFWFTVIASFLNH